LLGGGVAAALGYAWLSRRFFKPILILDRAMGWALLREALPLGGAILISIAYTRTAVFLLDMLRGPEATGLYGVAQKLTEPMAVIPAALMAAIFPAFIEASTYKKDAEAKGRAREQADWLRTRALHLAGVLGAAIAGAGALGGPWLIQLLYRGYYAGSAAILQILALALLPAFINYALTHFLVARGKQKLNLLFNVITFTLNLALCLALIPSLGPTGAAIAMLLSECALFGLCWHALPR
jgi:O-antigen/teichoic acid export membrane protein